MASGEAKIKMLTPEEANALLPRVRSVLGSLRETRTAIIRVQSQIEIEELTGGGPDGELTAHAQEAIAKLRISYNNQGRGFEEELKELVRMGAHLKDLDEGLVDFYSMMGQEMVFLCWKEGEPRVAFWHPVVGGFRDRQPL